MATVKQLVANRANARKSTGPKSAEGKAKSRLNAVLHGLSGEGPARALEHLVRDDLDRAKQEIWNQYRPKTLEQKQLAEAMAIETIRIRRCHQTYFDAMDERAHRARFHWEADQSNDAEIIFAELHKNPARWAAQLETSPYGTLTLLDRWCSLRAALVKNDTWTEAQRAMALDLLGVCVSLRDGHTQVDPDVDPEELNPARLALCDDEIDRLEAQFETYGAIDTHRRNYEADGHYFLLSPEARLLDRYEQAADRRLERARRRLIALGRKPFPQVSSPEILEEESDPICDEPDAIDELTPDFDPEPVSVSVSISESIRDEQSPGLDRPESKVNFADQDRGVPVIKKLIEVPSTTETKKYRKHGKPLNRRERRAREAQARHAGK